MPRAPSSPAGDSVDAYLDSLRALHQRLDEGMSFSGHERNKVFLNCGEAPRAEGHSRFAEASAISGLDFDDDARGLAFFDWDSDGDLDLALSNRTAPRIRLMRNSGSSGRSVSLLLEGDGVTCSRDAIGARVTIETPRGELIRSVRAGEGFLSQSSRWLHFGLGSSELGGKLTVRWPGGEEEVFSGARAGGRYRLVQGEGRAHEMTATRRDLALSDEPQQAASATTGERVLLSARPPAPALTLQPFSATPPVAIEVGEGTAVLLNLWASWCLPCRQELRQLAAEASTIRSAGIEVVALSTDGLGERPRTSAADAERMMAEIAFPFPHGLATAESLDKVDIVKRYLFDRKFPLALPFSLLIDRQGRIAALYRGGVDPQDLLSDVAALDAPPPELRDRSVPFAGRWLVPPPERASILAYARWFEDPFPEEAISLLHHAVELSRSELDLSATGSFERARARQELSEAHRRLAFVESRRGRHAVAAVHYRSLLELEPDGAQLRYLLGHALAQQGQTEAFEHLQKAVELDPQHASAHALLGVGRLGQSDLEAAAHHLGRAVELDPDLLDARHALARAHAERGDVLEATDHYRDLIARAPDRAAAHYELGVALVRLGRGADAVEHLGRAYALDRRFLEAGNNLAWRLATHPEAAKRDGGLAVVIARQIDSASDHREPAFLETLAAALAETGDFAAAAQTMEKAIGLARAAGQTEQVELLESRLELYRHGKKIVGSLR